MNFVLLAQVVQSTNPLYQLGILVIGAIASLGVLGAIFLLIARGFWEKTGKPVIEQVIDARKNDPIHIAAQKELIKIVITESHNHPDTLDAHKKAVRDIIDNETMVSFEKRLRPRSLR